MRLIDKDLVLKTAKDKEWGLWCEIANIKFAPEVKAIPIEWIEKQMAEREDYGDFNTAAAIGYLLLSWKEENEQNKESTSQAD